MAIFGEPLPDWKGAMILEESAESVNKRKWDMAKRMVPLLALNVVFLLIELYAAITEPSANDGDIPFIAYVIGILFVLIFIGVMVKSVKPIRFYENGFEFSQFAGQPTFMSYSLFERIDPPIWYRPGFYQFVHKKKVLGMHPKMPVPIIDGFPEKMGVICSRINDSTTAVFPPQPLPTVESGRRLRRLEFISYPLAYIVSLMFGFLFLPSAEMPPGTELIFIAFAFGIAAALLPVILLLITWYLFSLAKNSEKYRSENLSFAGFSMVMVFCLITSFIGFAAFSGMAEPVFNPDSGVPPSLSALVQDHYSDVHLYPPGDVLVTDILRLENVTLTMEDGAQIWVTDSGLLRVDDSTINSNGTFKFRVFGGLEMNNSVISNLWGNIYWPTERGGIEIYGGNASITNTTIEKSATRALMVSESRSLIANCTFRDYGYEGIILMNSPSEIRGNSFMGSETGIIVCNSTGVRISGNRFLECDTGVILRYSEAVMDNNTFVASSGWGISYDETSTVISIGNTFQTEYGDITMDEDFPMPACFTFVIIENIVVMGIFLYQNKKLKRDMNGQYKY